MLARGSNKDSFILSLLAHLRRVCEDDGAGGGGSLRLHTRPHAPHAVTQPFRASSVREPRRCRLPPRRPTAGRGARWQRASASYGLPSTAKHIPNDFDITFTNGRLRIAFGGAFGRAIAGRPEATAAAAARLAREPARRGRATPRGAHARERERQPASPPPCLRGARAVGRGARGLQRTALVGTRARAQRRRVPRGTAREASLRAALSRPRWARWNL